VDKLADDARNYRRELRQTPTAGWIGVIHKRPSSRRRRRNPSASRRVQAGWGHADRSWYWPAWRSSPLGWAPAPTARTHPLVEVCSW